MAETNFITCNLIRQFIYMIIQTEQTNNQKAISDLLLQVDTANIKDLLSNMFKVYIQQPEYRELDQQICSEHVETHYQLLEFFNRVNLE